MRFRRRSGIMLVTGGSGLLGRHLQRSTATDRWQLVAPGSAALDVRDREKVLSTVADWKPSVVIHLAYTKTDRRCTADGSGFVAEGAAACGARLIHLSSDVIFAGRDAPYTEGDIPTPVSEYGRMKADAEALVMSACPTAVMIRTSLMYGTDIQSPNQTDIRDALTGRSNTAFFTNEYRSPIHAADVAAAIGTLAQMPDISGPLNVAGPEALSRVDYAAAIARWMGYDPSQLRTAVVPDGARDRPGRVVLDSAKAATLGITCRPIAEALR